MIGTVLKKVFGSKNERTLKRLRKVVAKVNAFEPALEKLSDSELQNKTAEFRERLQKGETLDQLLPEAFACVREAARRTLGLRHFDVQMIGGMVLHSGKIAEMRTGEGKTLVATLPVYLNALPGKGVHVVTVNDYLANRDGNWMRVVYEKLGMTVGIILSGQSQEEKRAAYAADITYGTNNEYGFDYLRDNMALSLEDKVQRGLTFAIVDEVDSILIDEARTPLIISGAAENSSELYKRINALMPRLQAQTEDAPGHYVLDEKLRQADLTEEGHQLVEQLLIRDGILDANDSLYAVTNLSLLHHIHAALRAHTLFHRDVQYIVQENQVVLIDEHTGRTMHGRRLSEGLHQALEAKEGVAIQSESQTMASTTFQNYFRMYKKLGGMTGTADTEAPEFMQIYGLDVVVIPTNRPLLRKDLNDLVYISKEEKYEAIIEDVKRFVEQGAPVLVGTASVETSEEMSRRLQEANIPHRVLNAKFHAQEAEIIAQAGRPSTVTIATNMAGRGTDIVLGGKWEADLAALENPSPADIEAAKAAWQQRHEQVLASGGLHILGTERHESRRIDNQLRGRAGRQGDQGLSRFYLSLEDDLMRIFASDRVKSIMQALGMQRGEAIEHKMVTGSIEKAQRKVEGRNFDVRKQLLEYDNVASDQRKVIYQQRNDILEAEDVSEIITAIRNDVIGDVVTQYIPAQSFPEQWDLPGLEQAFETDFGLQVPISEWVKQDVNLMDDAIRERAQQIAADFYGKKCEGSEQIMRQVEKQIMLQVLDNLWKDHLASMDHLRQGINLRAYAQKDPKQEFKRESFELFRMLLDNIKAEVVRVLFHVRIASREEIEEMEEQRRREQENLQLQHAQSSALQGEESAVDNAPQKAATTPFVRSNEKVGRNDPCPCGSGKKYKQCHGSLA
ncbi:MAG: preprotein translocase subunit SecA [Cellvibrionales bacterium]|jgi:preprotein translocase subunit SecA|nr:preprotein translocase subunit SecA [Cellvibrionales bacterium]MBK8675204.1 preprotein translocase subunit SecA [Cellvibrionales bacterium]HRF88132.1 preprotein translocase subunit SecA [Pseudomonadales bacterium]HRG49631.1 preprotein translocase subunit SecA [Pseudomonadales bacterium]